MTAKTIIDALLAHYRDVGVEAEKQHAAEPAGSYEEGYWWGRVAVANESIRLMQTLQALEAEK